MKESLSTPRQQGFAFPLLILWASSASLCYLRVFCSTKSLSKEQHAVLPAHLLWSSTSRKQHHRHTWKAGLCAGERGQTPSMAPLGLLLPGQHPPVMQPFLLLLIPRFLPILCFSAPGKSLRLIVPPDPYTSSCALALIREGLGRVNVPAGQQVAPGLLLAVAVFLSWCVWLCARPG